MADKQNRKNDEAKHKKDIILTSNDMTWLVLAIPGVNLHKVFILPSWRHQIWWWWWTNREYHRKRECTTRCFCLDWWSPRNTTRLLVSSILLLWILMSFFPCYYTTYHLQSELEVADGWEKLHFILTCKMKRTRGKRKKGLINSFPHNNSSPLHLTL